MGNGAIMLADAAEEAIAAGAVAGLAGIWICMIVVGSLIGIFLFVVWILMLIDCIKRSPDRFPDGGENTKTVWIIILTVSWVVFQLWWVAAIVYYFMVKRKMPLKNSDSNIEKNI